MIPQRELDGIRNAIRKLDKDFIATAEQVIAQVGIGDKAALVNALLALEPSARLSTYLASQIASGVYNAWRLADIGSTIETVAEPTLKSGKWAAMANAAAKADTVEKVIAIVAGRIGYENRNAYAKTLFENGRRDRRKPKFARVPTGAETCSFCLMLGSRGFVYGAGKEGESPHNHANCDCVYVAQWTNHPAVEGYDPDELYDRWKATTEKTDN